MKPEIVEVIGRCRAAFLDDTGKTPDTIYCGSWEFEQLRLLQDRESWGVTAPPLRGRPWIALGMKVVVTSERHWLRADRINFK